MTPPINQTQNASKRHSLKVWPIFFRRLVDGSKTFEARWCDRDFDVGDELELREWDEMKDEFTDNPPVLKRVTYILRGPGFGVREGYCIMALAPPVSEDSPSPAAKQEERAFINDAKWIFDRLMAKLFKDGLIGDHSEEKEFIKAWLADYDALPSPAVEDIGEVERCLVRVDRESSCNEESCSLLFGDRKIIKGVIGKNRAQLIANEYNVAVSKTQTLPAAKGSNP